MTTTRRAPPCALRGTGKMLAGLTLVVALAACSTSTTPTSTPTPTPEAMSAAPTATAVPTPAPTPTPQPTPRFTNEPDAELGGLIPEAAGGVPIVRVPVDEFGLTPGDVGLAYGEIGARFASLAIGYVTRPRTTLYAMRVDGDPVLTADLEPHLATAGRYVGIAGLDAAPWSAATVADRIVWVRPEDNATAAGTMIYTWSAGEFVFLLIGVDDAVNRAIVAALPGEAPPSPTPAPSRPATPSVSPAASG